MVRDDDRYQKSLNTTNTTGNLFVGACIVIDSYFDMMIIEVPLILKAGETWRSLKLTRKR